MRNNKIAATLAALGAQVIFGFSFMFTKIALRMTSPLTVIADRYMVAFVALTIVLMVKKTGVNFRGNIWKLVVMSLFQPVLYFLFETYGIELTTSSFSSVMISLIPVVSMIFGVFFLKEIPSPMQYVFTALSVLGVAIMAHTGRMSGTVTSAGILLLLGAVVSSVLYNNISRKISSEFSALERTYAMTVIGLVVFGLIALFKNLKNPVEIFVNFSNPLYAMSMIYLGVVSSVVAFLLLNYANTYLPVAKTTVFSNLTTVVSVIAGIIILNEPFSFTTIISSVMIVIGVWGVQVLNVRVKKEEVSEKKIN